MTINGFCCLKNTAEENLNKAHILDNNTVSMPIV